MPKTQLFPVFVYGELKARGKPNTVSALGLLRLRGSDAAARFGAEFAPERVWGQVIYRNADQIKALDKFEAPEYKRVTVRLSNGTRAFAYADIQAAWEHEPIVPDGVYRWRRTITES